MVGKLELLRDLYGTVVIPPMVAQELKYNGFNPEAIQWMVVEAPQNHEAVQALYQLLDPGESEAIVLAQELPADLLLIDERRGWRIASGGKLISSTGLLGVLAEAKKKGLIKLCRPVLDDMKQQAGFWVGEKLRAKYLAALGEMLDYHFNALLHHRQHSVKVISYFGFAHADSSNDFHHSGLK